MPPPVPRSPHVVQPCRLSLLKLLWHPLTTGPGLWDLTLHFSASALRSGVVVPSFALLLTAPAHEKRFTNICWMSGEKKLLLGEKKPQPCFPDCSILSFESMIVIWGRLFGISHGFWWLLYQKMECSLLNVCEHLTSHRSMTGQKWDKAKAWPVTI